MNFPEFINYLMRLWGGIPALPLTGGVRVAAQHPRQGRLPPMLDCRFDPASMSEAMLPDCQLFGTLGCHLCEQAEERLLPFVPRGLRVELVDIAEREEWVERYGLRIPVLRRLDTAAELNWPFDERGVAVFLGLQAQELAE